MPEELAYLWRWYWEAATPPERITYAELDAWSRLTGRSLRPFEVEALRAIDRLRVRVAADD